MFNLKVCLSATLLLLAQVNLCSGRPAILQEQTIGYYTNFFKGCWVGVETLLSLLGYDEDEVVKANLVSETLDVNAADEGNQTSIQIAGLGLGRTGSTSLSMALEILGFTVCAKEDSFDEAGGTQCQWRWRCIRTHSLPNILLYMYSCSRQFNASTCNYLPAFTVLGYP